MNILDANRSSQIPQYQSGQTDSESTWPTYQYNAANTGYNPDLEPLPTNVGIKWEADVPSTFSQTSVGPERVYNVDTNAVVHSISRTDGTTQWVQSLEADTAFGGATIHDGSVYCGTGEGDLYSLNASTGDIEWSFSRNEDGQIQYAPTVVDGSVYHPNGEYLRKLDVEDGAVQWEAPIDTYSPPAVVYDSLYVAGFGDVIELDRGTGDERWRLELTDGGLSPVVVPSADQAIVGDSEQRVFSVDTDDESIDWSYEIVGRADYNSPAVADGTVYISDHEGNAYAVSRATGDERWRKSFSSSSARCGPVAGTDVVVFSTDGFAWACERDTGELVWSIPVPGIGGVVLTDDGVFAGKYRLIETPVTAEIAVDDQILSEEKLQIRSVYLSKGGFLTAYESQFDPANPSQNKVLGSQYFPPGEHSDVYIWLQQTPQSNTVAVVPHFTNSNFEFEYVKSNGQLDQPYQRDGDSVVADISIGEDTPFPDSTPTPTNTQAPTSSDSSMSTPAATASDTPISSPTATTSDSSVPTNQQDLPETGTRTPVTTLTTSRPSDSPSEFFERTARSLLSIEALLIQGAAVLAGIIWYGWPEDNDDDGMR